MNRRAFLLSLLAVPAASVIPAAPVTPLYASFNVSFNTLPLLPQHDPTARLSPDDIARMFNVPPHLFSNEPWVRR